MELIQTPAQLPSQYLFHLSLVDPCPVLCIEWRIVSPTGRMYNVSTGAGEGPKRLTKDAVEEDGCDDD